MLTHLTTFNQHSLKVVMLLRHRCQRSDVGKLREHGPSVNVNALNVIVQDKGARGSFGYCLICQMSGCFKCLVQIVQGT